MNSILISGSFFVSFQHLSPTI